MNQSNSFFDLFENYQTGNQSQLFGGSVTNDTGSHRGTNLTELSDDQNNQLSNNMAIFLYGIMNVIVIILCLITSIGHFLILLVLQRCRKMPHSLKLLSINFLCNSLLYFVLIILMNTVFLTLTEANTESFSIVRSMCAAGIYASHVGATGGLALERYIRIAYPLVAMRILRQRNIIVYIVCTWALGFLTSITLALRGLVRCDFMLQNCDLSRAEGINRVVLFCIFSCFLMIICLSYMKIAKETNSLYNVHNTTQVNRVVGGLTSVNGAGGSLSSSFRNTRNGYRATNHIMKINITFIVCHVPVLAYSIIFVLFPELETPQVTAVLRLLNFTCTVISFYVSSHFFIWKFKECKLLFMQKFCSWNRRFNDVTRDLKMEVYNIPTAVRRVTSPGKVQPIQSSSV